VPADPHEAARRIVEEVFSGSGPADVDDEPTRDSPPTPAAAVPSEREASPARLRARALVAEVFDPADGRGVASEPSPAVQDASPEAPTAAELAGRRIVAEAEAAQQDRAAAEAAERAAAERAAQQAEAAERAAAQRAAEEAEAAAHRERAQRARQEWLAQAQAETGAEAAPAPGSAEVLFVPPVTDPSTAQEGEALFDASPRDEHLELPPSSPADVPGPPPPPQPRLAAAPPGQPPLAPGRSEDVSVAHDRPQGPPVALALPEEPPAPQLAARLVSEVLDERAGDPRHVAAPEPIATADTNARALRAGRWVLVTVLAAVTLALLFPLAVRAVLELVSLS
jgi:dTMP kinase